MMNRYKKTAFQSLLMLGCAFSFSGEAYAQSGVREVNVSRPALVITQEPIPQSVRNNIYFKPERTQDINATDVVGSAYYQPMQTIVTRKLLGIKADLDVLRNNVSAISNNLVGLQGRNEEAATRYYTSVATVNTQLQAGTTPGNPRLVQRLNMAENDLSSLSDNVGDLNQLAVSAADAASKASFLLEETRSAFSISGAVEEDHRELARQEDQINNTVVTIERILNILNDDITRTNTYLGLERQNLRTLALAVTKGDLYGRSLANINFAGGAMATPMPAMVQNASFGGGETQAAALDGPLPLIKIRFDRSDVNYEEPLYVAVNEAMQRYPNAIFDLKAVHPTQGNAAEVAIESTKSRRNAQKVLRTLAQMGLDTGRVNLSHEQSAEAASSEVHIFIR